MSLEYFKYAYHVCSELGWGGGGCISRIIKADKQCVG